MLDRSEGESKMELHLSAVLLLDYRPTLMIITGDGRFERILLFHGDFS